MSNKGVRVTLYGLGHKSDNETDEEYADRMIDFIRENGQVENVEVNS